MTLDNQPGMSCRSYVQFHDDVQGADKDEGRKEEDSAKPNTPPPIVGLLEKQVAGRLTGVQIALARDTVIWKRGILVMPKVCLPSCFLVSPLSPPPLLPPQPPVHWAPPCLVPDFWGVLSCLSLMRLSVVSLCTVSLCRT